MFDILCFCGTTMQYLEKTSLNQPGDVHGLPLVLVFHCLSWGGGSVNIFLDFQDQYFHPWLILWFHLRPLLSPAVHLIVGPDPRQQHRVRHRALPTWSPGRPTKKLVLISVTHTNIVVAWIISRCQGCEVSTRCLISRTMIRWQGFKVFKYWPQVVQSGLPPSYWLHLIAHLWVTSLELCH